MGLKVGAEEIKARVGAEWGVTLAPGTVVLKHAVVSAPAVVGRAGQEPRQRISKPYHVRVLKDAIPPQPDSVSEDGGRGVNLGEV